MLLTLNYTQYPSHENNPLILQSVMHGPPPVAAGVFGTLLMPSRLPGLPSAI